MTVVNSGAPFERIAFHPVYITRVAGEPASIMDGLGTGDTARLLAEIAASSQSLAQDAEELVSVIEGIVPRLTPEQIRAALNVKRAIFNRCPIKPAELSTLAAGLDPGTNERIARHQDARNRLRGLEASVADAFDKELADTSDALLSLLERRNIVDGLSYSNPGLLRKLIRGLPSGSPSSAKGKERRNLEDSLLQYGARVATKTSPLSSFTMLGVDSWSATGNGLELEYGTEVERRIAFKGAMFRHLTATLLADFERAARLVPLEINTSARFQDGRLQLKAVTPGSLGSGRFWGTGEDRVEAAGNPVMLLIDRIFEESGRTPLAADELVMRVRQRAPKLEPAAVWAFLAKLYGIQYLRPALAAFEQDDPMETYGALTDRIEGEAGDALRLLVDRMRESARTFQSADAPGRSQAMARLQSDVEATCALLGVDHDVPLFKPVVFENCYVRLKGEALARKDLEPYAEDLELLLEAAVLTDQTHQTRCDITDFFLSEFGPEGICENVEAFLETFDEIYAPGKFSGGARERRAPRSETSLQLVEAANRFHDLLEPLLRGTRDARIDPGALREVLDLVPGSIRNRSLSQSYLLQFAREGSERLAVVNQMFGGRSALMSRFLEVLDETSVADVREYVRKGSDTGYALELPGVFGFNANYHPMLADGELGIPPFPGGRADAERVDLAATRMLYDEHTHSVCLQTAEGRRFDLFYQGFLIPSLLPSMHRVLALAFGDGPSHFAIPTLLTRDIVGPRKLSVLPRLRLGSLVLARRVWIIPFEQVPDIALPPCEFFAAVQSWRDTHAFPNEAFFRVIPIPDADSPETDPEVEWHTFKFKNLKPFYVRLDSPRFVRLMQRALKRGSYSVSLTEVLPALDDQHVKIAGEMHVAELQVEMTRPVRLAGQAAPGAGRALAGGRQGDSLEALEQDAFADWSTIRIAYFEKDRTQLLLGPVREAIEAIRRLFGPIEITLQTQWKFGPHVQISFNSGRRAQEIFELVSSIVEPWLASHPSREVLDPGAYLALSAKLGMSELEPGPYAPLLSDNTLSLVAFRPSSALPLPALAESKNSFLSEALDIQLELLALKSRDPDAFALTLIAMMVVCGSTYTPHGVSRGFMSFRSHAEYFFAAYDGQDKLRSQFDAMDAAMAPRVDAVFQALAEGGHGHLPLPDAHRRLVARWDGVVRRTAGRNEQIVAENHDVLVSNATFEGLVNTVTATAPVDFQQRARAKATSELGNAFDEEEGHRIQSSPEFIAFRTTVNFFYMILPTLEVSPLQKFCFCHLMANGAERHFKIGWREIVGLATAAVD
jgi:hypothetical protein